MKFQIIAAANGDRGFALYAPAEVASFLEGLKSNEAEFDKVMGLIDHVSREGPPKNYEKSKKLRDDIFELKSYQIRIAYIYDSNRRRTILMLHAIRKKSDDWPKDEMKVAKRLRSEALAAIEEGTIEYD